MKKIIILILIILPVAGFCQKTLNSEITIGVSFSEFIRKSQYSNRYLLNPQIAYRIGYEMKDIKLGLGIKYLSTGSRYLDRYYLNSTYNAIIKKSFDIHYVGIPIFIQYKVLNFFTVEAGIIAASVVYAEGADQEDYTIINGNYIVDYKRIKNDTEHFNSTETINQFNLKNYIQLGKYISIQERIFHLSLRYSRDLTRSINFDKRVYKSYEKIHSLSILFGYSF
ncbi:hypothetical protein QYS49_13345 [Marivirga salinae]|uniref:Outer membrane protein beta-barrel domain-containing protein n=1 Tax=Marivirga salinarum TaxID=3059078 RepID=A0AA49GBS4_9BACT|nr:hypothetical protein [Marivirga sp. BDSF4-3]WKK77957.1 hypothetical protein QYS49_13345 [Marivirga sp. BDSF4-3]